MTVTAALHPVAEAALASAQAKATLEEMRDLARGEACHAETVQKALIDAGMRSEPDEAQIRKIVVADALALLIEMFMRHETEARRLFSQLERTRRAA